MFSKIFMNVINSFLIMGIITFIMDINQQFLLFLNKAMMGFRYPSLSSKADITKKEVILISRPVP